MNSRPHLPPRSASPASRSASAKLAAALLLLTGMTGTALADATWVGDTSQDWNNAANWSSDPANPTGNFFVNTATAGVFPIIGATSAFAPVDIMVGNGAGQTGRLDITAGSVTPGAGNWIMIGRDGGTGTVNVGGTGILNCNGLISLAQGPNGSTTSIGTLNVNSGGTVNSEGDLRLAFAGNASTVGTVNIAAGGTVNVASTTKRWLIMSEWDATSGVLNVNGGALNLNAGTDIQFSIGNYDPGASNGPSAINLNSGSITMGAASVINLNNNASRAVNHTINLNGGVFTVGSFVSTRATGARVVNFNGGTLRAAGTQAAFLGATAVSSANVKAGGALIDSNGFDITIAKPLVADTGSPGGGLAKLGAGTLTLTGVNTYTGNTAVNAGTLALADNASLRFVIGANTVGTKITGSGTLALDGDFVIDLSGASTTVGHSWSLVDAANLTETYGASFTVADFSLTSGKWLKQVNGAYYQFDPATGVLSVITNPTVPAPTVTASPSRTSYATGSDIQFGVSGVGVGTLTYQWYFLAAGSSTPVLIDGATSATYTIAGATTAAEGEYSVVVTDSASATPTTVTFPAFTLQAGTAFSLAYYRFENDASDEIGSNDLTPLGSPAYVTSVSSPTIARTGVANTASVNLPASGDNGFVSPTNSTLATAQFEDFTIEAFVRFDSLAGWQTIVGRDDDGAPGQGAGDASLFYLSKAGAAVGGGANNGLRLELITKNNTNLQVNSTTIPVVGTWYHVAAVGDATKGTLTLYVDGVAVGTTTGYTGLLAPTTASDTPWTIGRGEFGNNAGDYLRGNVDEVRFSATALPPRQFLIGTDLGVIVPPPITSAPASRTVAAGSSTTLSVVVTGAANYEWYKDDALLPGQTGPNLVLSGVSAANEGSYRVKVINTLDSAVFSSATATVRVLTLPAAGKRTLGLNFVGAGSGNWSDTIYAFGESEVAGFYPSTNWNNSAAVTNVATQATPLALEESTGLNPAGSNATWASGNTWSARIETGAPGAKSEHGKLIHGYIESRAATGATVTVSNIPYASYDVYVYVSGGNGGDRVGSVGIDRAGTSTYFFRSLQNDTTRPTVTAEAPYAPFPMVGEALTIEEARTAAPATFVRYTGVTGSDLTITTSDAVLNQNAGGMAAVQIVDTTPIGAAYPPVITTAPTPKLVKAGASASFSVAAITSNSGGTLSYAWTKEGSATVLGTSSTLTLSGLTSANTGRYIVTVTETSSLGSSSSTRPADLVVVDSARSVLINGDINAGGSLTYVGDGVLRADGSRSVADLEAASTTWNGIAGAAGAGTGTLTRESTGLGISGVTFSFSGASGAESNNALGNIAGTVAEELEQDYLFVNPGAAPLTATVGGLQAFAGHQVTLLVYAVGKTTKTFEAVTTATVNDTAVVTLETANNHLSSAPVTTTVVGAGTTSDAGRNIEFNSPEAPTNGGISSGYAVFTGVVDGDGRVSWTIAPDTSVDGGGLAPLVGFQLLVTGTSLAPAAPANLQAVAGNNQVSLSWNSVSGAQTYTVKRSGTAGGPYSTLSAGALVSPGYTDNSALNGNTYYYVVAAANSIAQGAHSAEASATLASTASALETWRQTYFGSPANSGAGADTADFDNDGLANLLEYALGTLPDSATASPVVVARSGAFLTLSFPHRGDSTVRYHIDSSNDLSAAWTLDTTGQTFSTAGNHTHTDTVNLSTQARRFLRLRVTTP